MDTLSENQRLAHQFSSLFLRFRKIASLFPLVVLALFATLIEVASASPLNSSIVNLKQQEVVALSDECMRASRALSPSDKPEPISLEGGKSHCYRIVLQAGDFVRVLVEQQGNDVAVSLFEPDESQKLKFRNVLPDEYELKEIDTPTDTSGAEPFSHIATVSGEHMLMVRSILNAGRIGNYSIRLTLRRAVEGDATFVKAERLFVKGWLISSEGIRTQKLTRLEQGVSLLKEAYSYAPKLNNQQFEYSCLSQLSFSALVLANSPSRQGNNDEALGYMAKHVELSRLLKKYQEATQDHYNEGLFYLTKFRDVRKADEFFNKISLELERLPNDEKDDALLNRVAFLLNLAGAQFYGRGDYSYAVSYYEKALSVVEYARGHHSALSVEPAIVNNIGTIYISIGEFEEAQRLFDTAYKLLINLRDDKDLLYGKAWITVNLGLTYYYLGKSDIATKFYQDAINTAKEYKRTLGPNEGKFADDPEIAALSNLGVASSRAGDRDTGIKYLRDAIAVAENVSPREKGRALTNLGRALSDSGRYEEALSILDEAITILSKEQYLRALGYAYTNKAFALNKQSKTKEAEALLKEALDIQRALKDAVGEIGALYVWATVERDKGDAEKALEYITQATDKLEPIRSSVSNASLRLSFFTTAQPTFDLKIDLLLQMNRDAPTRGYAARAFDTHESSRARVFLDLLSLKIAHYRQQFSNEHFEQEEQFRGSLYPHSFKGKSVEELLNTAELEKKLKETVTDVLERDPQLRSVAQPLNAEEIKKDLQQDVLVLEYRLSSDRGTLWAVAKNLPVEAYDLGPSTSIRTLAEIVIDGLSARGRKIKFETTGERIKRITRDEARLPEAERELGKILLSPVLQKIKGKRLAIVADGPLQYLPFSALRLPSDSVKARRAPYLIERHEILYLPSASALKQLTRISNERNPLSKTVTLFAPKFNGKLMAQSSKPEQLSAVEKSSPNFQTECLNDYELPFRRLAFNLKETETIAALLKTRAKLSPENVRLRQGAEARKELIQGDEMGSFGVIHLATHGIYNDKRPECSGVALAPPDKRGTEGEAGGYLTMPETFDLKLSADLVVLSACETASGKDVQGEGIVGLTRGFLYSGASRVISSLWIVNTKANSVLMEALYENIFVKGQRPSKALQDAQNFMLRNPKYRNPYYWAGFIQQGIW